MTDEGERNEGSGDRDGIVESRRKRFPEIIREMRRNAIDAAKAETAARRNPPLEEYTVWSD